MGDPTDGGKGLAKEPVPCDICAKPCALYADEIPADGLCPVCRYSMAPDAHKLHGVTFAPPMTDPTPTEPDAPMYVPPDSAPVLQSLIEESAKLGHWALHEQLRAVLASVEGERARHAEEVARLEAEAEDHCDVTASLLLPDVRACAEYCEDAFALYEPGPVALAARRILAALDSHECPECHRNSDHKMSCSRGGSKGGRFGVSLDSQGGEGE